MGACFCTGACRRGGCCPAAPSPRYCPCCGARLDPWGNHPTPCPTPPPWRSPWGPIWITPDADPNAIKITCGSSTAKPPENGTTFVINTAGATA